MMSGMNVVFAVMTARPEYVDDVEHHLLELQRRTRDERGALGYAVHRRADNGFLVYEQYIDQAACDAHFAQPYVIEFLERSKRLLVAEPRVEFGVEIDGSRP